MKTDRTIPKQVDLSHVVFTRSKKQAKSKLTPEQKEAIKQKFEKMSTLFQPQAERPAIPAPKLTILMTSEEIRKKTAENLKKS